MDHSHIDTDIKATASALRELKARHRVLKRVSKANNALHRELARLSFLDSKNNPSPKSWRDEQI